MNIQTLTSPSNSTRPSEDALSLRYTSSPPMPRYNKSYSTMLLPKQPSRDEFNYNSTDLQSVVSKYHSNPELLKLILASKVEEDKRRTEEAKLKAKELDLYFKKQNDAYVLRRRSSSSSSTSSTGSNSNVGDSIHRRIAPYAIPRPIVMSSPRRNSTASAFNQLSINAGATTNNNNNNNNTTEHLSTSAPSLTTLNPPSSYLYSRPSSPPPPPPVNKISRRRRSMQAITKIVETTEFPYDDRHFWKNNGNTIQKKTGCKSVYYKCANSCKGCPVNKTVVEQPDGSYVIKYRGDHISECSQVEHIKDL